MLRSTAPIILAKWHPSNDKILTFFDGSVLLAYNVDVGTSILQIDFDETIVDYDVVDDNSGISVVTLNNEGSIVHEPTSHVLSSSDVPTDQTIGILTIRRGPLMFLCRLDCTGRLEIFGTDAKMDYASTVTLLDVVSLQLPAGPTPRLHLGIVPERTTAPHNWNVATDSAGPFIVVSTPEVR